MSMWRQCDCGEDISDEQTLADEILGTKLCRNCGRENSFLGREHFKRGAVETLIERMEALEAIIQP